MLAYWISKKGSCPDTWETRGVMVRTSDGRCTHLEGLEALRRKGFRTANMQGEWYYTAPLENRHLLRDMLQKF